MNETDNRGPRHPGAAGRVGIAGTGKASRFLMRLAARADLDDRGLWGRRGEVARALAQVHGASLFPNLLALVESSSIVFLAVSDGALTELAEAVAAFGLPLGGKVFAHLSGLCDDRCLAPLADLGAVTGSIHPMMTLHDGCPLAGIHFFAQSEHEAFQRILRPLVEETGNHWHPLTREAKALYHGAATLLCQGISAATQASRQAFLQAGFGPELFVQALGPLARETLRVRLSSGDPSTLTGPAVRGDQETADIHREALSTLENGAIVAGLYDGAARFLEITTHGGGPARRPPAKKG